MSRNLPTFVVLLTVGLVGCGTPDDLEGAISTQKQAIFGGERFAETLSLASWETAAIGWLHAPGAPESNWCTVTLIAPRVALTAAHCLDISSGTGLEAGFGVSSTLPESSIPVLSSASHPTHDVAILILERPATKDLPSLLPLPLVKGSEALALGDTVEVAGVGETGDPEKSGRFFAALEVVELDEKMLVVDGKGERGVCFGDSGGPALVKGVGGAPTVEAIERGGEASCVGRDYLTRVGPLRAWIQMEADVWLDEPVTGFPESPTPQAPKPVEPPVDEQPTGCAGLSYQGGCEGETAIWCDEGERAQRDCGLEGKRCGFVSDAVGYYCLAEDTCADLPDGGECEGASALRCEQGQFFVLDCARVGATCGFEFGRAVCQVSAPQPGVEQPVEPLEPPAAKGTPAPSGGCAMAGGRSNAPVPFAVLMGICLLAARRLRRA